MGGREGNPDSAFQAFVTGIYAPTAEGGTAIHAIVKMGFSTEHRMNCLMCCRLIIAVMRNCG